jgi:hypothetical protein
MLEYPTDNSIAYSHYNPYLELSALLPDQHEVKNYLSCHLSLLKQSNLPYLECIRCLKLDWLAISVLGERACRLLGQSKSQSLK